MDRHEEGARVPRHRGRTSGPVLAPEIARYYASGIECGRLSDAVGRLERARTEYILRRSLPPPPGVVLDVGGGPGVYALELARRGYRVHLIEPVPLHLEQAAAAQAAQPEHPLAGLRQGDARALPFAAGLADAVLLLGPLYHLPERADRRTALGEAYRVLRPGGVLCAAAISRFASALDGMRHGTLVDPLFAQIVERDLRDGRHENPTGRVEYFTTAYLHRPDELHDELAEAGFESSRVVGVEGPAWLLGDLGARWNEPQQRLALLQMLAAIEDEAALLGSSAHLVAIAHRRS